MNLQEIKDALAAGKEVRWKNDAYVVHKAGDQYMITFIHNDSTIGLTWRDGVTMNGEPEDFYVKEES